MPPARKITRVAPKSGLGLNALDLPDCTPALRGTRGLLTERMPNLKKAGTMTIPENDDRAAFPATHSSPELRAFAARILQQDRQPVPVALTPVTGTHDAISIAQIVLDAAFAGGAHIAYTGGTFRRFERTHWISLSEADLGGIVLKNIADKELRRQRTPALIRDVIATLRHATASSAAGEVAEALPVINVRNGELWLDENGIVALRPHDPASGQRHCLEVVHRPTAICPRYDRALADIFSASADPAALIALWNEIVGYLLQPIRRQPLILVAAGRGRDGKSALAETLVRLLGRAQVTAMPVEDLTGSRFVLGDLAESRAFLDFDMTAGVLLPDGPLKKLSEGTTVTAERKFRDRVTFTMRAVPLLLTNNTPRLMDQSLGFRRRLLVLPFDRQFDEAEVDYGLFPEIYETELSGVLNRALDGLRRVIRRGWKFDLPGVVTETTDAWWAEATGVSSPRLASADSWSNRKRKHTAPLQIADAGTKQRITRASELKIADPGPDLTLRIKLREAGKGCKVLVQAGAAEIEVRVTGASAGRAPPLPELKNGC